MSERERVTDPTFEQLSDTIAGYPDRNDKVTIALGNFNRVRGERDALAARLAAVETEREKLAANAVLNQDAFDENVSVTIPIAAWREFWGQE